MEKITRNGTKPDDKKQGVLNAFAQGQQTDSAEQFKTDEECDKYKAEGGEAKTIVDHTVGEHSTAFSQPISHFYFSVKKQLAQGHIEQVDILFPSEYKGGKGNGGKTSEEQYHDSQNSDVSLIENCLNKSSNPLFERSIFSFGGQVAFLIQN
jgi:hypothetical protein